MVLLSDCCSPWDCLPCPTTLATRHGTSSSPAHNHRLRSSAVVSSTTVPAALATRHRLTLVCIAFLAARMVFQIAARQRIVCPAQPLWLSTTVLAALVIRHWPTLVWTTAIVARAAPIGSFCPSNCCSPLDCLPRSTALAARHDIFVEPGHNHRSLSSAVCSGTTVPTTRATRRHRLTLVSTTAFACELPAFVHN